MSYASPRGPRAGIAVEDTVFDAADATGLPSFGTVLGILGDWETAEQQLKATARKLGAGAPNGTPLSATRLLAPVLYPSAIYCAGANYQDHVDEMARAQNLGETPDPHTLGLMPWHFLKPSRSVTGPDTSVPLPEGASMVDWEVELVAVIGRRAKAVPVERALEYVAGYTLANDLSARDLGRRPPIPPGSPFYWDWVAHKCFDGSCPLGPWLVPAAGIPDPQSLAIKLWKNDVLKQDSNTSNMIYTIAEQIAQLSRRLTLYPGDLVLTGTPAGVGAGRGEYLASGDTLRLWCENIGSFSHQVQ